MKKIDIIELCKRSTGEFIGFSPSIKEKGKKTKMFLDEGEPILFKTKWQAKEWGLEKIKE